MPDRRRHPSAFPRSRRPPLSPCLPVVAMTLAALVSCERASESPPLARPSIEDLEPLSRRIEAFVGGPAKIVWAKQAENDQPDASANSRQFELWGIDTRDGRGVRRIMDDETNFSRPLVSASGDHIIFTHRQPGKKIDGDTSFKPFVFRTDWEGRHLEMLAAGYATDVWRDPVTQIEWVYVADLAPSDRPSLLASKLERFELLDPGERELVWDKTQLSTENIQLSHDGTRASALFPWPDSGVMNLVEKTHRKHQTGCWPSLAPDNSYLSWVFDGSHKNLHLFTDQAEKTWKVPLHQAPGLDGHEVYHPRWSNHVRFLTMTGPYVGETIGSADVAGVEIYLGRFAEDMKSIEDWLIVTQDRRGDFFPDLWIKYPEPKDDPAPAPAPKPAPKPKAPERDWPVTGLPLLFTWEHRNAANLAGEGGARQASVEARGRARFGPRFEMFPGGGWFEADAASAKAVAAYFAGDKAPFTLEALATPHRVDRDGVVLGTEHFQLKQLGGDWYFLAQRPHPVKLWIGYARPGLPNQLVVAWDGAEYAVFHNGKAVSQGGRDFAGVEMLASRRGLTFGAGWEGALEAVSLAPGRIDEARIAASWAYLEKKIAARPAIPRARIRGKLLEMTASRPVEALDTYRRGLLGYRYRVEEVLEGRLDADTVVVIHWTIMDRQPLRGFPRRPGETYELLLEPASAHPELVSERQWNDILEPLEPYYDVATPPE